MLTPSEHAAREERKTIAYSAAAIFVGAIAIAGTGDRASRRPRELDRCPGIGALVLAAVAIFAGPRIPRSWLAVFAPIGVAGIAYALATTSGGPSDGAVLYMWPVLWMSYFYGRAGAVFIVAFVALAQGVALLTMPDELVSVDRWIDVVASVTVVAAVVRYLASRNTRLVRDLEEQARVDPLTGLLNRRGLEERMGIEVNRALRQETPMAVAIVDIDHFKDVNDEHGHEIGDRVLAWVGGVLARQSRGVDVAARTGGDEFAVLLPDTDRRARPPLRRPRAPRPSGPTPTPSARQYGLPEGLVADRQRGRVRHRRAPTPGCSWTRPTRPCTRPRARGATASSPPTWTARSPHACSYAAAQGDPDADRHPRSRPGAPAPAAPPRHRLAAVVLELRERRPVRGRVLAGRLRGGGPGLRRHVRRAPKALTPSAAAGAPACTTTASSGCIQSPFPGQVAEWLKALPC